MGKVKKKTCKGNSNPNMSGLVQYQAARRKKEKYQRAKIVEEYKPKHRRRVAEFMDEFDYHLDIMAFEIYKNRNTIGIEKAANLLLKHKALKMKIPIDDDDEFDFGELMKRAKESIKPNESKD